ncbi:MAG: repeat-containing protein [Verrucomicrobiales bacterium]|nr:repeat-containing protein [Verrucomicrobiales bacterium]
MSFDPLRRDCMSLEKPSETRKLWLIAAILAFGTLLVFWPALHSEFINYDDPDYITHNPNVQAGLTPASLAWAFQLDSGFPTYWHPVTWLSLMLDCQLFGLNPTASHAVNIGLHAINAVLLLLVLRFTTGSLWRSALVAALFAIHPLQVDSVAWVTERKNVLSTMFWLLTMLSYARYVQESKLGHRSAKLFYSLTILVFAIGLMSKPMLVTLPCVLLLFDYWPLRRCDHPTVKTVSRLLIEKIPLFVLSLASGLLTVMGHHRLGLITEPARTLGERLGTGLTEYLFYVGKVMWPSKLAVCYTEANAPGAAQIAGAIVLLGVISAVAIYVSRKRPYLMVGWLWFLGSLLPVSSFLQAGVKATADRFMYVPIIGLLILMVWAASDLLQKLSLPKITGWILGCGVLGVLTMNTRAQLHHWQNSLTLFEHAVAVTTNSFVAHYNLGCALHAAGRLTEAREQFITSIPLNPVHADAHYNLGNVYSEMNEPDAAVAEYKSALVLDPGIAGAHNNLGALFNSRGQVKEAEQEFLQAIKVDPKFADAHSNFGNLLFRQGRYPEAEKECMEAVRLNPKDANSHFLLGRLYSGKQPIEAAEHFRAAVRLRPSWVLALRELAWLLATHPDASVRNGAEAVALAKQACDASQQVEAKSLDVLAAAHAETGDFQKAISVATQAQQLAVAVKNDQLADSIAQRLHGYHNQKPFRMP